jgi:hypothetical protein
MATKQQQKKKRGVMMTKEQRACLLEKVLFGEITNQQKADLLKCALHLAARTLDEHPEMVTAAYPSLAGITAYEMQKLLYRWVEDDVENLCEGAKFGDFDDWDGWIELRLNIAIDHEDIYRGYIEDHNERVRTHTEVTELERQVGHISADETEALLEYGSILAPPA